ncbi:MAG: helix-turn-helix transcriptional regulator [Lachnospiraceae bacterium]|nr:helix-turn-helix transcriptional regulator [Lachnospiraceae bacterium]
MISYHFGNYGFIKQEKMKQLPITLYDMGIEHRCMESYSFDNTNRPAYDGYLLQYTFQGYGIFEADGNPILMKQGMGFFCKIPENSKYYLPNSHYPVEYQTKGWDFFYIHFDGSAADAFYEAVKEISGSVFSLEPTAPPIRLFLRLFETCERYGTLDLYEGSEFLYRFLSRLLRELEAPSLDETGLVHQARTYIREHFRTLESLREVADFCQVSHEHLTRRFKKETGQSPLQYLTKLRIEHALFLLLNTTDSIETIAISCGFQNGNYFAKVFRKFLQCSPEEYRRRNTGQSS